MLNKPWSLKRRIVGMVMGLTVVMWAFSAVVIYHRAGQESQAVFDAGLQATARLVLDVAAQPVLKDTALQRSYASTNNSQSSFIHIQMWSADRQLIYQSHLTDTAPFVPIGSEGFSWVSSARWQGPMRVYAHYEAARHLYIQVAELQTDRHEISSLYAQQLFWFCLIVIPLFALIVGYVINRVCRMMQTIADEVSTKSGNDLQAVSDEHMPIEIKPLTKALNDMIGRIRLSIEHEKQLTADAAHELRTPLAGIRANVQVIERSLRNHATPIEAEALAHVLQGVDRCARLIDQLLQLGRADTGGSGGLSDRFNPESVALSQLVADVVREHKAQAEQKSITLSAQAEPCLVMFDAIALRVVLRNLLDNAIRYNTEGGQVVVVVGPTNDGAVILTVADDGPGISLENRTRVFDRFYRGLGHRSSGSGLGLSIVYRMLVTGGASICIMDGPEGQGVMFEVYFPADLVITS